MKMVVAGWNDRGQLGFMPIDGSVLLVAPVEPLKMVFMAIHHTPLLGAMTQTRLKIENVFYRTKASVGKLVPSTINKVTVLNLIISGPLNKLFFWSYLL